MPEPTGGTVPLTAGTTPSPPGPGAAPATHRVRQVPGFWLALLGAPLGLSSTSPALILPDMAGDLGVSVATVTWFVTVFFWAIAVGTPLVAGIVRRRGLRPALMMSACCVAAGVVLVVASPWFPLIVLGRAAQAFGGAGLVTIGMNLAGSPRRMGLITAGASMCGAVGPLGGSLIADAWSWHVSLALSAVTLLAVPAVARYTSPAPTAEPRTRFDFPGAAATVALVTSLVFVPHHPVPAAVAAVVAAVLVGLRVRARPEGFVPSALLRSPVFLLSSVVAFALSTSYFALLYAVPALLERDTSWSKGQIGTVQLVALVIGSALSWGLAALSPRMNRPALLTVLIGLGALALAGAVLTPWAALLPVVAAVALFAASSGQATLSHLTANAAREQQRPTAIGLFNLCYQLGGAFGPAIVALLAIRRG
ncbi:MFS transporter [Streptomyces sp. NPDC049577]|uniref:MFS transporter n=1 Tax=Streptomyces sp. NPDC049577 TaxID=3155153 RepID=UPI0034452215